MLVIVGQAGEAAELRPGDELRLDADPPGRGDRVRVIRRLPSQDQPFDVARPPEEDRPDRVLAVYEL
jgi:hypothetical protein